MFLDGLVNECLRSIKQYQQAYAAPRAEVSQSLDEMISKGFPPDQNTIWHKRTSGQRQYYSTKNVNGEVEVRVKTGSGTVNKAGKHQYSKFLY